MTDKPPHRNRLDLAALDPRKTIHFAGIAGSAMSGLARLMRQRGYRIVGTDPRAASVKSALKAAGVVVYSEQDGSRIPGDAGLVVATAAIPEDHPELAAAMGRGIPVVRYAEMLGALMGSGDGVAVAGTHGKTSTTALVVACLKAGGLDPGFVIGGHVPAFGANAESGASRVFVAEACEYNRSFLQLSPRIAVITNIEEDHLDIYGSLDEIKETFSLFASRLPPDGVLIYSADCPNTQSIVPSVDCQTHSFGVETEATYMARDVRFSGAKTHFDFHLHGDRVAEVRLALPGVHNVANALAALAVCHALEIPFPAVCEALAGFRGVTRRFDLRGEAKGITVVDDYAHHPTEIRALMKSAGERFPGRRLVVVFQPHQSSRTLSFLDRFAESFQGAGLVIVPDIYSVRDSEEARRAVHATDLVERIAVHGVEAAYGGSLERVVEKLVGILEENDVLLTVGAGDVDRVAEQILSRLSPISQI